MNIEERDLEESIKMAKTAFGLCILLTVIDATEAGHLDFESIIRALKTLNTKDT